MSASKQPGPTFRSDILGWIIGCGPPLLFVASLIVWLGGYIAFSGLGDVVQAIFYGFFALFLSTFAWMFLRLVFDFSRKGEWGKVVGGLFVTLMFLGGAAVSVENMHGKITPLIDPDAPGRR